MAITGAFGNQRDRNTGKFRRLARRPHQVANSKIEELCDTLTINTPFPSPRVVVASSKLGVQIQISSEADDQRPAVAIPLVPRAADLLPTNQAFQFLSGSLPAVVLDIIEIAAGLLSLGRI